MADENTTSSNSLSAMAAAFNNAPVPAQQQENPITYNTGYDTSTDAYGAPINQQQPNTQNQPAPQQQPTQQPNNPANPNTPATPSNVLQQFLDPNVTEITVPDPNTPSTPQTPDLNVAFQQLADTITAANNNPNNNSDPNASPMTEIFNTAYGEDIDFGQMMQSEGDAEEINKNMQQAVKEKMSAVYANAITQSVSLAQQLIDRKFTEFAATQQAQQQQQSALQQLHTKLPFTQQPHFSGLAKMMLDQSMAKTNNNVTQSLQIVEELFRLSNPNEFGKPNHTRFAAPTTPQSQGRSGPRELTLDNIDSFMS